MFKPISNISNDQSANGKEELDSWSYRRTKKFLLWEYAWNYLNYKI